MRSFCLMVKKDKQNKTNQMIKLNYLIKNTTHARIKLKTKNIYITTCDLFPFYIQ